MDEKVKVINVRDVVNRWTSVLDMFKYDSSFIIPREEIETLLSHISTQEKKEEENNMRCDECTFWVKAEVGNYGDCRFDPPQILLVPMPPLSLELAAKGPMLSINGYFPKTRPDLFCGHFMRTLSVVGEMPTGPAGNVFPIRGTP